VFSTITVVLRREKCIDQDKGKALKILKSLAEDARRDAMSHHEKQLRRY